MVVEQFATMLSHNYRIKLEEICSRIVKGEEVSLGDMVWAEKLAAHNQHAARLLRQARRSVDTPDMVEGDLDDFMNQLDLGGTGSEARGVRGFESPSDLYDWFRREDEDTDEWRRRD